MRILLVHNFYRQPGGEDALVRAELAQLEASGHQVLPYFVLNDNINSIVDKIRTAISVTYNHNSKESVAAAINRFQPDLMHVHNFFPLLSPSIFDAARDAGIPSILSLHNFRILCPTATLFHDGRVQERSLTQSSWWTVPKRTYRNSFLGTLATAYMVEHHKRVGTWRTKVDRFIASTQFSRTLFEIGGIPSERITVKPNGLVNSINPPEVVPRVGALFVGRLSVEKGILPLVRLWRNLGLTLTVVGDGPLRSTLLRDAGPDVHIKGRLDATQVQAEMRRAALLIVPSLCYDTFPLVLIEAFACGLPVLASRIGGLPEIVDDGVTGWLFDQTNPADIVRAVRLAAADPERLQAMGCAARDIYERQYTAKANGDALLRIYHTLLDTAPRCGPSSPNGISD